MYIVLLSLSPRNPEVPGHYLFFIYVLMCVFVVLLLRWFFSAVPDGGEEIAFIYVNLCIV